MGWIIVEDTITAEERIIRSEDWDPTFDEIVSDEFDSWEEARIEYNRVNSKYGYTIAKQPERVTSSKRDNRPTGGTTITSSTNSSSLSSETSSGGECGCFVILFLIFLISQLHSC